MGIVNLEEVAVPLVYSSNFSVSTEVPLINSEISIMLIWSANCIISKEDRVTGFWITDTKLFVPLVTLSTQDNLKLLKHLKLGFTRIICCNKYQWKVSMQAQNQCINCLIDPHFQGVNKLVCWYHLKIKQIEEDTGYYPPTLEIKDYNIIIYGKNVLDQVVRNDIRTYENIRKIALGQGDDYTTVCLLEYPCFKKKIMSWFQ